MSVELSTREIHVLKNATIFFSTLSLVASLVILCSHYAFVKLRSRSAKLVVWLTVCVAGSDITALSFLNSDEASCSYYALFSSFYIISCALWSASISRTMSLVVIQRNDLSRTVSRLDSYAGSGRYQWKRIELMRMLAFHAAVWGFSFACSIAVVCLSFDEPVSDWCWYVQDHSPGDDDHAHLAVATDTAKGTGQLLVFYVPLLFVLCYNLYVLISPCLHREEEGSGEDSLSRDIKELADSLRYFVIVEVLILVWLCVCELVNLASLGNRHFYLYLVLLILLRLQGLANLYIYFRRKEVRTAWRDFFVSLSLKAATEPLPQTLTEPLTSNYTSSLNSSATPNSSSAPSLQGTPYSAFASPMGGANAGALFS